MKILTRTFRLACLAATVVLLAACGGGGGGGAPAAPPPPPPPPDTVPNSISFQDQTDIVPDTVTESPGVTITGINMATPISIVDGEYSVNGGAYTSEDGTVVAGDIVTVRVTASSTTNTTVSATVTVGGVDATFTVTTEPDTLPDAFSFPAETDVDLNVEVDSAVIVVGGVDLPVNVSIVGGEYSIDGGAFTNADGTIDVGQSLVVRVIAADTPGTTLTATLTIGDTTETFDVTTLADLTPPTATVDFPPLVSRTYNDTIRFRGSAADDLSAITDITINGESVATSDGFATWTADVSLSPGINNLDIETQDAAGNIDSAAAQAIVTRRFRFGLPTAIALDSANGRALVVDSEARALVAVDLSTGERSIVSNPVTPNGNFAFINPVGVVLDSGNGRALVLERDAGAVMDVNLADGTRTVLSDISTPDANDILVSPTDLVLDAANNRALVVNRFGQSVIAVDLTTGARTVISDSTTPNGANYFFEPFAIDLDPANGRALVTNLGPDLAIYAVDLTDGSRTILSDDTTPDGTNPLSFPSDIVVDSANGRALVAQPETDSIYAVDLATGARTVFSGPAVPDAVNPFEYNHSLKLDAANNRVLVIDQDSRLIMAADLTTGARTIVSESELAPAGIRLDDPRGIALSEDRSLLLLTLDGVADAVAGLEIHTGLRSLISDSTLPDGVNPFFAPIDIVPDFPMNRAFVLDQGDGGAEAARITIVDLTSGARTLLATDTIPDAINALDTPLGMSLDSAGGRLLVTDESLAGVIAVDLTTGARTVFSDNVTPDANQPFSVPTDIVIDESRNRALVTSSDMSFDSSVLGADLGTGSRSVVSDLVTPDGQAALFDPRSFVVDADNDRALLIHNGGVGGFDDLISVDLTTGARTVLNLFYFPGRNNAFMTAGKIAYDPVRQIAYVVSQGGDTVVAVDTTSTGEKVYLLR